MKRFNQPCPRPFVILGGLLVVYLLLPLGSLLPRISVSTLAGVLQPEVMSAAAVSAETATVTTLLLLFLGIPLSYLLARCNFPGKTLIALLVQLPLALPPSVAGILLLMAFGPYSPVGSWLCQLGVPPFADNLAAIVAAQAFVASPFLIISARTAFEDVDPTLEQVATTFGKSPTEIFRRITLSLAWPAIRSGITLAWVRALGEFGANAMVAYHPYSLPVLAWVQFSESGLNSTVPLVVLMLGLGVAGVAFSYILAQRSWSCGKSPYLSRGGVSIPRSKARATLEDLPTPDADLATAKHRKGIVPIAADIQHDFGDFSLDVHFRTVCRRVAILGRSGAGKSLILKSLAGLIQPAHGCLTIGTRTLYDSERRIWVRPDERRVGYVPQHFALFPHMTVWQNVLFATDATGTNSRRATALLRLLGLEQLSGRYPNQLSFGQQQRAALARALVRNPDYLLLDEPFASLDAPLRLHLRRELLRILCELDLSVVLVTHDSQEAYELVDEVIFVDRGRVLQQGERETVFNSPSSLVVAQLLGFRNTFQGQVLSSTSQTSVIRYQNFSISAREGPFALGTMVDFFVDPQALTVIHSGHNGSLPPGTIMDGVIDAIWRRPWGNRLAVTIGNGISSDCWEIEEVHNGKPLENWSEREPVRLFLPVNSIRLMGRRSATG
jgi:molybdate transport system ATP-binding protein/molybdate transport system permease protein